MIYLIDAIGYLIGGLTATMIYIIIYELVLLMLGRKIFWSGRIGIFLLGIYLTIMFSVTVSPMYGFGTEIHWEQVNLLPGQVIRSLVVNPLNFLGNIAMFLPLGFFVPLISRKFRNGKRIIILGMSVSFLIESLQLFLGRGTDIDDLILNTMGSGVGFALCILIMKCIPELKNNTGILMKASRKKVIRDGAPVIIFIGTILVTVILTGFYKRNEYLESASDYAIDTEEYNERIKLVDDGMSPTDKINENDWAVGRNKTDKAGEADEVKERDKADETYKTDEVNKTDRTNKADGTNKTDGENSTGGIIEASEEFKGISLEAGNVYLMNAAEGTVKYSKNSDEKIAPASTAKMLTALTVISYCELEEEVTVGDEINYAAADASKAGLREGNVLTIQQLLEGLLLPSGNDAAYVLAVYTGRKIADNSNLASKAAITLFLKKLNEVASAAGANRTNILSPDGYDTEGQYTTAHDLALIAVELMNTENAGYILKNIVKQTTVRECFSDGTDITWQNSNKLLDPTSEFYYENAVGLKTGGTETAGKCLISAAVINNKLYIAAVMGSSDDGRYTDTLKLYKSLEE